MIVIVGCVMVLGAVLAGFLWEGGHLAALVQPAELVVIGGAALGALVVMSSKKVIVDLVRGIVQCVKGTPYSKKAYEELFKVLYELFRLARRDGLIALESHLSEPDNSTIFAKYPGFAHNHHVMDFTCGALSPVLEGTVKPDQLIGIAQGRHQAGRGRAPRSAGRVVEDGRRHAGLRHRGRRVGNRHHDAGHRRPAGGDRRESGGRPGGHVPGHLACATASSARCR